MSPVNGSFGGIEIDIQGRGSIRVAHLVMDLNGTLALDGVLLPGTAERVDRLRHQLECHLITADTHGGAQAIASKLGCRLKLLPDTGQDVAKASYVIELGRTHCVAIGNGANDASMLAEAVLGICVIGPEGAATAAVVSSGVVCQSATDALDLLLNPLRLAATLRR